ncbi:oxidoreductase [Legionella bononiensis]|uniref:Oxidoreductase n=1 Tax=Legionella bononiensis TaxID=2793102 RepID=A0ABS1WDN6_9GAMM|nr:oxidoreductase [Legionella bononiensis]MBL7481431.1 oxidoreductase [Legionella bononiensis]MBL7527463.1 oxidoreductase [Legionella bononiensis]
MGKGIILRVLEGTEISPELSRTLDTLIPNYKIEYFQEKPDYKRSYERRINSLHDAFLFMLDAYPLDPKFTALTAKTLKAYAEEVKESCDLTKDSVEELQKELENYTARLVEVIATSWDWPKGTAIHEGVACLNEAEQYVLMSQGRPDLATLMPMQMEHGTEYILQYDESLPPYSEEFLNELKDLKSRNYPKTPVWFKNIDEYQKAYFTHLKLSPLQPTSIMQDINSFIASWDEIKGASLNIAAELDQIYKDIQPYPTWYKDKSEDPRAKGFSKAQKEMIKVLAAQPDKFDANLIKFKEYILNKKDSVAFRNSLDNIANLPLWYWSLSKVQQSFLAHVLQKADRVEDVMSFLSSRHRTLPIPANYAAHSLLKINPQVVKKDQTFDVQPLFGKRFRSSHIVSRDVLDAPESVQQRHSDANFAKVMEHAKPGQLCLLQTLISPLHGVDYIPSMVLEYLPLPPDLELFKYARATVQKSGKAPDILQHNHPFNYAKYFYYTASDDPDSLHLLKTAQTYVANTPGLQDLLDEYKRVLESPLFSATFRDYVGRELFLTSLEQLITLTVDGHSYGSCVSGKDRKAIELMHTDAMILFKEKYGVWPKFGIPSDKVERINFVNIFADIYMTRHQHEHAGQNAPGSDGIKTPDMYLPADIIEAINARLGTGKGVQYDDVMATDNEVKNISKNLKSYFLSGNDLLCKLTARQLGEDVCTKLYDALTSLINEESRFHKPKKDSWGLGLFDGKKSTASPTGINKIRGLMQDKNAGNDNILRLEKIFSVVISRPVSDSTRTKETNSIYDRLRDLLSCIFSVADEKLDFLADKAVAEWSELFEASKRANSTALAY